MMQIDSLAVVPTVSWHGASRNLGQPVLVENLAGAGGSIAANKVLAAPADGYYLFQGSPNELVLASLANAAIKLKAEDFRAVQMLAWSPLAITARKAIATRSC